MIDLIAIRARDEDDYATAEVLRNIQWAGNTDPELTATINMVADRHALLAAYDALAAENARLRAQIAEMQGERRCRVEPRCGARSPRRGRADDRAAVGVQAMTRRTRRTVP